MSEAGHQLGESLWAKPCVVMWGGGLGGDKHQLVATNWVTCLPRQDTGPGGQKVKPVGTRQRFTPTCPEGQKVKACGDPPKVPPTSCATFRLLFEPARL